MRIPALLLLLVPAALAAPGAAHAQRDVPRQAVLAAPAPVTEEAVHNDAITAARFSLTVDGYEIASFSEFVSFRMKRTPPTITLKRGKNAASPDLEEWLQAAQDGSEAARKSASLVMYDAENKPVARYHLEQAWPSKIEIGALRAGSSDVLMETVTIVSEEIRRVGP